VAQVKEGEEGEAKSTLYPRRRRRTCTLYPPPNLMVEILMVFAMNTNQLMENLMVFTMNSDQLMDILIAFALNSEQLMEILMVFTMNSDQLMQILILFTKNSDQNLHILRKGRRTITLYPLTRSRAILKHTHRTYRTYIHTCLSMNESLSRALPYRTRTRNRGGQSQERGGGRCS